MTLPLCILHAGAEKTGSTSLQHFLWLNEAALAAQKIWVPRALLRDPNQTVYNHEALCTASRFTLDEPDDLQKLRGLDSVAAVHAHRAELVQSLAAERAALNFTPERILVSNEHVHGRLRAPEDLARARALLTPFCGAFHVVAYLRRQDEMARSYAAMAVRQGAASLRLIPDFATHGYDEVLGLDELHFDFAAFLDRLGATFGQEALNVRLYAPRGVPEFDIISDFFAHIGVDISAMRRPPRQNTSTSLAGCELMLHVNPLIAGHPRERTIRKRVLAWLARHMPGELPPAPAAAAMRFVGGFAASNEIVRRRWFPDQELLFAPIPPDRRQPPPAPLSPEQAASLLAEILRQPETAS